MSKKNFLIVGSGFRGIVAADKLKKTSNVDLIEKLPFIGGVLYSEEWNGFFIDKGIHIFDNVNDEDTKLIQKILKNKFLKVSVKYGSRINDKTSSAVAMPDFTTLSPKMQKQIAHELFECTYNTKKSKNLHEFLINNYGKTASKYFITLAKKYFAIDPKKLSPDAHKNNPLSRGRFFADSITLFLKTFEEFDSKLAIPVGNEPMKWHPDVTDKSYRYFYPAKRGLREFCDNAFSYLENEGINVKTKISIKKILNKKNKLQCDFSDGTSQTYDHIIWTIDPIHLYNLISSKKITSNSGIYPVPMIVYYFIVDRKNINDFTYIQDFTKDSLALRGAATGILGKQIINNKTYIDVEVPTKINSNIWKNPEKFYERIWNDVVKMGLVKGKIPKEKKFVKTPVSFRGLLVNYKEKNNLIENKIHQFSNRIHLLNQENSPLFKILESFKHNEEKQLTKLTR